MTDEIRNHWISLIEDGRESDSCKYFINKAINTDYRIRRAVRSMRQLIQYEDMSPIAKEELESIIKELERC